MVPLYRTPHEAMQERLAEICHDVLGDSYIHIVIKEFKLVENIENSYSHITCELNVGDNIYAVCGEGHGIVDALFGSAIAQLNNKYSSLNDIQLRDFAIEADFASTIRKPAKTDAKVEARLLVQGGGDGRFVFRHKSRSMNTAAVVVVAKVIEYFINSEEAVAKLYSLIRNATERSRGDLADVYTSSLSELVKNVSYENKMKVLSEEYMKCEKKR